MDEVIYVGPPDEDARKELLELELLKRPHEDIDTARIVELTKGLSSRTLCEGSLIHDLVDFISDSR